MVTNEMTGLSKLMELKKHRRESLRAARELHYSDYIISRIKIADTIYEIDRALVDGRKEM